MISEELKQTLKEKHDEEMHDAAVYEDWGTEHPEYRSIFHGIAREEYQHANLLRHIIEHI